MSTAKPPVICESVNPGFFVKDIKEAVDFYSDKLGFRLEFMWGDPPRFAALSMDKVSIHLMTQTNQPAAGMAYFPVDDAEALYAFHVAQQVNIVEPIEDRNYDMRDYLIRDPYGNHLSFGHFIMSKTPPLQVERTVVPVRLEKRLASLLTDLAAHKGMTMDSLFEETFLHTFEPFGDGVASPHTKSQLQKIQELKKKHGIDYDVHASYRFVEKA